MYDIAAIEHAADISEITHISNINQGGEVYLTEGKVYICDDQGYLISMDRNLENRETVIQEKCQYVTVTKDAIYFTDENMNICKTTLTGANKEVLVKTKSYYVTVIDEYIYYDKDSSRTVWVACDDNPVYTERELSMCLK